MGEALAELHAEDGKLAALLTAMADIQERLDAK